MIKKTLEFEDFNGTKRKGDYLFHLSAAEVTEMDIIENNGLKARLDFIASSSDGAVVLPAFKDLLKRSYGIKSADGVQFMKSDEIWRAFEQSGAYEVLILELFTDMDKMIEFSSGLLPKDLANRIPQQVSTPAANEVPNPQQVQRPQPQDFQRPPQVPQQYVPSAPAFTDPGITTVPALEIQESQGRHSQAYQPSPAEIEQAARIAQETQPYQPDQQ